MKRKFKVVFTILLVLTAIIPVLAYKRIAVDYPRHVQELRERSEKWGIEMPAFPWYAEGLGAVVVFLVVVTIDAWIVSSIIWFQERRQKNQKEVKSKNEDV